MGINFDFAKKFAAEKLTKQIFNYLQKDPDKNFEKYSTSQRNWLVVKTINKQLDL